MTKLDRLGRSLEHLINLVIDTSTAVGRMFFQIRGAIAESSTR